MVDIQFTIGDLHPEYGDICDVPVGGVPVFLGNELIVFAQHVRACTYHFPVSDRIAHQINDKELIVVGSFAVLDRDPVSHTATRVRLMAVNIKETES